MMRAVSRALCLTLSILLTAVFAPTVTFAQDSTTTSGASSGAQATRQCHNQQLKTQLATSGNRLDQVDSDVFSSTNLFVVGEVHGYANLDVMFNLASRIAGRPGNKCLLLEVPSAFSVSGLREKLQALSENPGAQYYIRMIDHFEDLGFTPHHIDDPREASENVSLNTRDQYMAGEIQRLHRRESSECDVSILVAGKAHWTPDQTGRITLKDRLNGNITTTSLNLMDSRDQVPNPKYHGWSQLCSEPSFIPRFPVMFRNSQLSGEPIYPNYVQSMRYEHFDYTILY